MTSGGQTDISLEARRVPDDKHNVTRCWHDMRYGSTVSFISSTRGKTWTLFIVVCTLLTLHLLFSC